MSTGPDRPDRRRSREAWPDPDAPLPVPVTPAHTHRMPGWVRWGLLSLTALVLALSVAVAALLVYVQQLRDAREHQQEQTEEQIRGSFCDLLDLFPSDVEALDAPRETYDCGPGAPPRP